MKNSYILGFDPGGKNNFGWAVGLCKEVTDKEVADKELAGVEFIDGGTSEHVLDAINQVISIIALKPLPVAAAAIDSPLTWNLKGPRDADDNLRPGNGSSVMAVNSLFGSCLTQGVMCASKCVEVWPEIRLTESHPKVLIRGLVLSEEPDWVKKLLIIADSKMGIAKKATKTKKAVVDDHEADAIRSLLSAWAILKQPSGWMNLLEVEQDGEVVPYRYGVKEANRPEYWMPIVKK